VIDDDAWERELQRPGVAAMKTLLYCEDCVPGIPLRVEQSSADLVVTSPPYNLKVEYGAYQDDLSLEDYLAWTAK
jgi:DNA modification methylase